MRVLFGGTFDPVHIGHLRMALELAEAIGAPEVNFVPCYEAVHKAGVSASPAERLKMLQLATKREAALNVDEREILRQSASFTIDTLREVRAEDESVSLVLAVGSDSARNMSEWKEIESYADLCHVVVMERPGHQSLDGYKCLIQKGFDVAADAGGLKAQSAGKLLVLRLNLLEVSSSDIRERVNSGRNIRYLVEDAVHSYIWDNGLYQPKTEGKN